MAEISTTSLSNPNRRPRAGWYVFGLVLVVVTAASLYAAASYGRAAALESLIEQGRIDANLKVALLRAVLERPRALPVLLARDRDVEDALRAAADDPDPSSPDLARDRQGPAGLLSRKLEDLVADTQAAVIYVVAANGVAISASNWQEDTSFVGNDYRFRTYFSQGIKAGRAEHYALGSVSKRPGLYVSHRVGPADGPLGVVVAKMEFDQLESDWGETQRPSFVVDDKHVVLISSIPSWRFMTTEPLAADKAASIRDSLQFGDASLKMLPVTTRQWLSPDASLVEAVLPGQAADNFLRITAPVASTTWQFQYLVPIEAPIAAAVREALLITALVLAGFAALAGLWLWRRQSAQMVIIAERLAREELETRVETRTRDLSLARDSLQAEITNHRATETRLQAVQQDLVQANRLAILGQVAAGVAHEINQPVATIRAYADNAQVFLERQQTKPVVDNLVRIAGLTERIGAITDDLRALARRGRTAAEPVILADVIDGAKLLLRSRFTGRVEAIHAAQIAPDLKVVGNRLRLEQVFINLFQNGLEATEHQDDGHVRVQVAIGSGVVTIRVGDNGPGIDPAILDALFEPFNSSKVAGLGLGLVISKDIVTDYGGQIDVETGEEGTTFVIELQRAEA